MFDNVSRDNFDFGPEVQLGLSHERLEEAHAYGEHAASAQTYKRAEKFEAIVGELHGKAEVDYHCKVQEGVVNSQTRLTGQYTESDGPF